MNAVVAFDASGLAETVERARALLDEGDVTAARMLAAGAYDQAKAAAGFAARFGAAEGLIGKARRLQGDALLIEARAKVRLAAEYDAAQAAGFVRKPGQRGKAVADSDSISTPTTDELGVSRQDIHEARKLAEAERRTPGIVERAIAARLLAGLEPSRANLRAAVGTDSATAAERGNNLYETPIEAMRTLLALERFSRRVYEPACGRGAIVRPMEAAGYDVALSDLVDYGTATAAGECQGVADFLCVGQATSPPEGEDGEARQGEAVPLAEPGEGVAPSPRSANRLRGADLSSPSGGEVNPAHYDIVTNPPYGALLNAFVAHALRVHRPRKMALLLNLNFLCGFDDPDRCFAMDENPPARVLVFTRRLPMMHRDGWDGNEASSRMNCAWFVWEQDADGNYAGPTIVSRVDWKDFENVPALPPADRGEPREDKPQQSGECPEAPPADAGAQATAVSPSKRGRRKAVPA